MTAAATFYARSFDAQGEYWCVLDANHHIVSKHDDMTHGDAHRLADEMNDELDAAARARLEHIANTPTLMAQAAE